MESELVAGVATSVSRETVGKDLPLNVLLLAPDVEVTDLRTLADKDHLLTWYRDHGAGLEEFAGPASDVDLQIGVRRSGKRSPAWRPFLGHPTVCAPRMGSRALRRR